MSLFLKSDIIRDSVGRLVASGAQRGFTDFLILKRALKRISQDTVPFSMRDPEFTGAIRELAGTYPESTPDALQGETQFPFFKVFGIAQGVSRKMLTNGPADTLSGPNWQSVVILTGQRPRKGGLRPGYADHLDQLLLKRDKQNPSLHDAAVWYFRSTDVETRIDTAQIVGQDALPLLVDAFTDDLGLTPEEISRLFDVTSDGTFTLPLPQSFTEEPADPHTYLPTGLSDAPDTTIGVDQMADVFQTDTTSDEVGLHLPKGMSARFIAALLSKRFVILTGLSGSGKTKLAQALPAWLCPHNESGDCDQYVIQAVGSDWTNREPLLGYPDALSPGEYRMPSSGALPLILRAIANPATPHFLILDEMNLSHVERYFADILSAMEAGQQIPLHDSINVSDKDWGGVPATIVLPPNLFVIGTVNVDETTYMFSPKVLDRGHVIEFRVSAKDIDAFAAQPKSVDLSQLNGKGSAYAESFVVQAARQDVSADDLDLATRNETRAVLNGLFEALEGVGAEFGYRPIYEIFRFLYFHGCVTGHGRSVDDSLDAAIMQKILPKLHGSKTKLTPVLTAIKAVVLPTRFPISYAKVVRMEERLKQNGFTSYAEA